MKKIILVAAVAAWLFSCGELTNETPGQDSSNTVALQQAWEIANDYLFLDENQYSLELTVDQASKLGIFAETLTALKSQIDDANMEIMVLLAEDPDRNLLLSDPQVAVKGNPAASPIVKTRAENDNASGELFHNPLTSYFGVTDEIYLREPNDGFFLTLYSDNVNYNKSDTFALELYHFKSSDERRTFHLYTPNGYWSGFVQAINTVSNGHRRWGVIYYRSGSDVDMWGTYTAGKTPWGYIDNGIDP